MNSRSNNGIDLVFRKYIQYLFQLNYKYSLFTFISPAYRELRTVRQPLCEFAEAVSELHASGSRRFFNRRELSTRAHRSETREALAEPLLLGESAAYEAASRESRAVAHSAFLAQCSRFEGDDEDSGSGWDALVTGVAELPAERLVYGLSSLFGGDGTLGQKNEDTRLEWWAHWLFERVGPQLVLQPSDDLQRTAADLITVLQHVVSNPMGIDPKSPSDTSIPMISAALRRLALTNRTTLSDLSVHDH